MYVGVWYIQCRYIHTPLPSNRQAQNIPDLHQDSHHCQYLIHNSYHCQCKESCTNRCINNKFECVCIYIYICVCVCVYHELCQRFIIGIDQKYSTHTQTMHGFYHITSNYGRFCINASSHLVARGNSIITKINSSQVSNKRQDFCESIVNIFTWYFHGLSLFLSSFYQ